MDVRWWCEVMGALAELAETRPAAAGVAARRIEQWLRAEAKRAA